MAQHRDLSKRPDRAQLRRALGMTGDAPEIEDLPVADDQSTFEQQALITLLEVAAEIGRRLDQLEEAQLQTAETIAALGTWLQRNLPAAEDQPDIGADLAELRVELTKRADELLGAIRQRPDAEHLTLGARADRVFHEEVPQRVAVVPALREVLSVTRQLQARLDAPNATSALEAEDEHDDDGHSA